MTVGLFAFEVFIWKWSKTDPFWPCIHIFPLWKRIFSTILIKTKKSENGALWKRSVFSVSTKNGDILKRVTFLCWIAIEYNGIVAFKLAIGTFLTTDNKRHCFEKGSTKPFSWSNVNVSRFHSVFICKRTSFSWTKMDRNENKIFFQSLCSGFVTFGRNFMTKESSNGRRHFIKFHSASVVRSNIKLKASL